MMSYYFFDDLDKSMDLRLPSAQTRGENYFAEKDAAVKKLSFGIEISLSPGIVIDRYIIAKNSREVNKSMRSFQIFFLVCFIMVIDNNQINIVI